MPKNRGKTNQQKQIDDEVIRQFHTSRITGRRRKKYGFGAL